MVCVKGIDRINHVTVIGGLLLAASALTMGCPFDARGKGSLVEPIPCTDPAECNDGNPCTDDECTNDVCTHVNRESVDPWDDNECTDDLCAEGAPSNPPAAMGAPCAGGTCDGQGNCVIHCDTLADCPGHGDFCKIPTCVDHRCGFSYEGVGTPLPDGDQIQDDCKEIQCDGNGGTTLVADDSDTSVDSNECTTDTCNNGNVSNAPAAGEPCSGGQGHCDSSGECKLSNGQSCSQDGTCESGYCVDKTCCNSPCGGTCRACNVDEMGATPGYCADVPAGQEDNNPMNACAVTSICVFGGACGLKNGQPCEDDADCASGNCAGNGTCSQ